MFETMEKVEILLGGLNCANCARKIEDKTQKLEGVSKANLNFINRNLKFNIEEGYDKEKLIEEVIDIIDTTEPGLDIEVLEKKNSPDRKNKEIFKGCECLSDG